MQFIGRAAELTRLLRQLKTVADTGAGVLLSIRGRRQVGKSRLVEELLRRAEYPGVFFTAARAAPPAAEVHGFVAEVANSPLAAARVFADATPDSWEAALRLLAAQIAEPTIVVIDELPFLLEGDPSLEGVLQRVWDRQLSRVPVLLVVVGSDLSMMESLSRYDRPLYQRMRELVIQPLNPAETAEILGLSPAEAFDAQLTHGGFPALASAWRGYRAVPEFLASQLADATSPLVVVGERILNVEFPPYLQARQVLEAIGVGQTTFSAIASRSQISQGSLNRTLHVLVDDKRVVEVDRPLSAKRTRHAFYRVADPYLRFWLRFIGPHLELLLRDRGDLLTEQIVRQWSTYRGRAIEPLIRQSIERLLPDQRLGEARYVGSYWSRTGELEVDLVGGRERAAPTPVSFVGSVKWRDQAVFDRRDLVALATARGQMPGAAAVPMVGVSRGGFATADLDVALGPAELLTAWRHRGLKPGSEAGI